jgi:hypothetical protein
MFDEGRGVAQSDVEATRWFLKTADQGTAVAQYNLGIMVDQGRGIGAERHGDGAVAPQGSWSWALHADVQHNPRTMFSQGCGVALSDAEAVRWYRKAEDQG